MLEAAAAPQGDPCLPALPTHRHRARHPGASAAYDIYSRLLKDNIIFLGTAINDDVANAIVAQMLFTGERGPDKDIQILTAAGITAGLAIYDTMQFVKNDIVHLLRGPGSSMRRPAALRGHQGKRFALPNSRIMIHQPAAGPRQRRRSRSPTRRSSAEGHAHEIMVKHTGQPIKKLARTWTGTSS